MKIGIMQPYFFPYLGYWQLINAVDSFVIYDDVNYIKGGWINRNYILSSGKPHLVTVPLAKASSYKMINEIEVLSDDRSNRRILKSITQSYGKAPFYENIFPIIEKIVNQNEENLAIYLEHSLLCICDYLGISTEIIRSSSLHKTPGLKGQDKILNICQLLGGRIYINAIGGKKLYSFEKFLASGIELCFLETEEIAYSQGIDSFVPNLSIIDVLMFNRKEVLSEMLNSYSLVKRRTE